MMQTCMQSTRRVVLGTTTRNFLQQHSNKTRLVTSNLARINMSSSTTNNNNNNNQDMTPLLISPDDVDSWFTSTADLYDAYLDQARVLPAWTNYGAVTKFWGHATTIKCFEDNSRLKELAHTTAPTLQSVLVVDAGGSTRCAVMGDQVVHAALDHGWKGVWIAGCVRDTAMLRDLPLGICALGSTPRKSTRRNEGHVNLTIDMSHDQGQSVVVNPGDLVFVDTDGILVMDPLVFAAQLPTTTTTDPTPTA